MNLICRSQVVVSNESGRDSLDKYSSTDRVAKSRLCHSGFGTKGPVIEGDEAGSGEIRLRCDFKK